MVKDVNNQSPVRVESHATGIVSGSADVSVCRLDVADGNNNQDHHHENSAGAPALKVDPTASTSLSLESHDEMQQGDNDSSPKSILHRHLHRMRRQLNFEMELLSRSWKLFLFTALFQYIHSTATNLVYYLHEPTDQPIKDLGFLLLTPALEEEQQELSEVCFSILVGLVVFFALQPLLFPSYSGSPTRFVLVHGVRYARVLVMAQALRCVSFLVTVLPSPNFHCRAGAEDYDPPADVFEVFFRFDAVEGCGDLIFSSHTIFCTLGCLLIHQYNPKSNKFWYLFEGIAWILLVVLGFLVVAARKHYTVDVVIAWYTCPLLWFYVSKTWPDDLPRSLRAASNTSSSSNGEGEAARNGPEDVC